MKELACKNRHEKGGPTGELRIFTSPASGKGKEKEIKGKEANGKGKNKAN